MKRGAAIVEATHPESNNARKRYWAKSICFLVAYIGLWMITALFTLSYYDRYLDQFAASAPARPGQPPAAQLTVNPTPRSYGDIAQALWPTGSWASALHALDSFLNPTTQASNRTVPLPFESDDKWSAQHAILYRLLDERLHDKQDLRTALGKVGLVVLISVFWIFTFLAANHFTHWWIDGPNLRTRKLVQLIRVSTARVFAPVSACIAAGARNRVARMRGETSPFRICDYCASVDLIVRAVTKQLISAPFVIKVAFGIFSLIPVFPFVVAMSPEYEPAVFVMALVAIFVAGEHYGGLRETEHELHTRTEELHSRIGIVLDADGLNEWRSEVYQLYSKANDRIDAVIRSFDIDNAWWKGAAHDDKWRAYLNAAEYDDTTLLHTLKKTGAFVQFVTDLPLQPRVEGRTEQGANAKFFRDLLGLAWQLVVFEEVHRFRQNPASIYPPPYLRIKVAHAPCWMHVVDDVVYQIIERGTAGNATVRRLSASITDTEERRALARWARDSIQTLARRGGRAEEYLFSLMRRAALDLNIPDEDWLLTHMKAILNRLGLVDYLTEPNEDFVLAKNSEINERMNNSVLLREDQAEDLCIAVFDRLISMRFTTETCQVRDWCAEPRLVRHLASETL